MQGRKVICTQETLNRVSRFSYILSQIEFHREDDESIWGAKDIGDLILSIPDSELVEFFELMAKSMRSMEKRFDEDESDRQIVIDFYKQHPELFGFSKGQNLRISKTMDEDERNRRIQYRTALMGQLISDGHIAKIVQWKYHDQQNNSGKALEKRLRSYGKKVFYKVVKEDGDNRKQ